MTDQIIKIKQKLFSKNNSLFLFSTTKDQFVIISSLSYIYLIIIQKNINTYYIFIVKNVKKHLQK